jgi:hypothetical protein
MGTGVHGRSKAKERGLVDERTKAVPGDLCHEEVDGIRTEVDGCSDRGWGSQPIELP